MFNGEPCGGVGGGGGVFNGEVGCGLSEGRVGRLLRSALLYQDCQCCTLAPGLCHLRQIQPTVWRLPPADGAELAIGAPVPSGATLGGAGEPLDGGQLAGQALAVDGSSGGGGVRHAPIVTH